MMKGAGYRDGPTRIWSVCGGESGAGVRSSRVRSCCGAGDVCLSESGGSLVQIRDFFAVGTRGLDSSGYLAVTKETVQCVDRGSL